MTIKGNSQVRPAFRPNGCAENPVRGHLAFLPLSGMYSRRKACATSR